MLEQKIADVRFRLRTAAATRWAMAGGLIGLGMVLLALIVVLFNGQTLSFAQSAILCVIPMILGIVGCLTGGAIQVSDQQVAALIDDHGSLKDRAATMLHLSSNKQNDATSSLGRLQEKESAPHIASVEPTECVQISPGKTPLRLAAGLMLAIAATWTLGFMRTPRVSASSTPSIANMQAAGLAESMLPELEKMAEETEIPEIEELLQELREQIESLDEEAEDSADVMAKLSEMEQAIAEAREAMNIAQTDAEMKSIAEALSPSEMMREAANAMESQKYDDAASELDSIDPKSMKDSERRAVANRLKKMVASMSSSNKPMSKLSKIAGELAEAMEKKDASECKKCLGKLAGQCKNQSACKKCGQCMAKQLSLLSQCKGQCRGQCDSPFAKKSNSPSQKAGSAASGEATGENTERADVGYDRQEVTGQMGSEGDSDTETMTSPETEATASRGYTAKYNDFRKAAEEVLENEPLPQSHRQTVRDYFESIRPSNEEASTIDSSSAE
ncbi:MAG: hypothetical protein AAFV88_14665 [Planctomycetota bacterium]